MVPAPSRVFRLDSRIQMKRFGVEEEIRCYIPILFSLVPFFIYINSNCAGCNTSSAVRIYQGSAPAGQLLCEKLRGLPHSINMFWFRW